MRTVIGSQITNHCFEGCLGNTHDIVIRDRAGGTAIGQRQDRTTVLHELFCALRHFREGVGGNHHCTAEIFARGDVCIAALQFGLIGEADGVNDEVELSPLLLDFSENGIDRCDIFNIARQDEIRTNLFGQRLHALAECITLIGECEFCALCRELL